MRHIPEDELHAYLDQGLSRSQCVEIESHLAGCSSCRAHRDSIAALRDRTTALLAKLAPPRRFPPAFETLRALAAQRVSTRRRRIRTGAWAASLVAALGLGWSASLMVGPSRAPAVTSVATRVEPVRQAPPPSDTARPEAPALKPEVPAATPVASRARQEAAAARQVARRAREDSVVATKLAVLNPSPAAELKPVEGPPAPAQQFDGMWRTMPWDAARSEAGTDLPHVDGLPVLQVQFQAGEQGKRPLMVVAQQLASGQVIQTIEGPAADVSELLSRRAATSSDGKLAVSITEAAPAADQSMAMQMGDRMIAITGALPSDSLRAMIRRMSAEMRGK